MAPKTKKENISSKVTITVQKGRVTTPHYVKKAKAYVFTHFEPTGGKEKQTLIWAETQEQINKLYQDKLTTL